MLYEVREANGGIKLFFRKKKGFKFKKCFSRKEFLEDFVEEYLRHCCLACKGKGWVYKTRLPQPLRSSLKGGGKGVPPVGTVTACPECGTQHRVQHEDVAIPQFDGTTSTWHRVVLVLAVD